VGTMANFNAREAPPDRGRPAIRGLLSARRILVLGPSGAGKTRLALQLGKLLNRKLIHLDAQFWKHGWVSTPQKEWREVVAALARDESWIMDGTYESTLEVRIPRADAVIVIEDNRWNCLYRAFWRRLVVDRTPRPDAPPGQKLDISFLRYIWNYSKVTRPMIMKQLNHSGAKKLTFVLHGPKEVREFLHEVATRIRQHGNSPG
jgi:adenylate kinase family enzyme